MKKVTNPRPPEQKTIINPIIIAILLVNILTSIAYLLMLNSVVWYSIVVAYCDFECIA
jgi:hypothetical protein